MLLERVGDAATYIIVFAALGKAIDFWLGKVGQERVRAFLETWWIRFSYVKPNNVGREEAKFAADTIDRIFKFKGITRSLIVSAMLIVASISFMIFVKIILQSQNFDIYDLNFACSEGMAASIFYMISMFLTYQFALLNARWLPKIASINALYFMTLFGFQSFMLNFGSTVTSAMVAFFRLLMIYILHYLNVNVQTSEYLSNGLSGFKLTLEVIYNSFFKRIVEIKTYVPSLPFADFSIEIMTSAPAFVFHYYVASSINLFRLGIVIIFVLAIVARPLHKAVETLWIRALEDKTPIFTLTFGGAAAAAQFIKEIVKLLSGAPA